jgi:hypothetical protein
MKNSIDDFAKNSQNLGPFAGYVSETSVSVWLHLPFHETAFVTLHEPDGSRIGDGVTLAFNEETLHTAIAIFEGLTPNRAYRYRIWQDPACLFAFNLGLGEEHQEIWTLPTARDQASYRYDFLLLSCNNPDQYAKAKKIGDGYEVWRAIPQILKTAGQSADGIEHRVLFALMGGDQVYADKWKKELLAAPDEKSRRKLYLEIYRNFWNNDDYRKILAGLPSYMIWDDHDIMDGWGSEISFFQTDGAGKPTAALRKEWENIFRSAKRSFAYMQANRNGPDLYAGKDADEDGLPYAFDQCFRIGPMGFVLADLRTHRNLLANRFWTVKQFERVKSWIDKNRGQIDTLFFVSPVVFAHGSPEIESGVLKHWPTVMSFFTRAAKVQAGKARWPFWLLWAFIGVAILVAWWEFPRTVVLLLLGLIGLGVLAYRAISKDGLEIFISGQRNNWLTRKAFHFVREAVALLLPKTVIDGFEEGFGDLSDDIKDSWGGEGNESLTEELLLYLFDLQNSRSSERQMNVVILSGDIHSGGYSNIYSAAEQHSLRPTIPHVVSSPVGYTPFPWIGEAFYRKFTKGAVPLGSSGTYTAQVSHHFTARNVVVCSLRKSGVSTADLKCKFYVEGTPEPQTAIFDLDRPSHIENIQWSEGG